MARFPFVDGQSRREALERCVDSFDRWRLARGGIERVELTSADGRVAGWASGLSRTAPRPLVLISGGIVSVKEQWAPVLRAIDRLGLAAIVVEMPGVGENTLRYTRDSATMLSDVLDALRGRARVDRTYAMALSFSGHLALRCAVDDPRIRGIVTSGAPVAQLFRDREWQRRLPRVTADTLAHLTGAKTADLGTQLDGWELTDAELSTLDIPVHYLLSRRDEIIPDGEVALLRKHLPRLRVLAYDDVHGAPSHVAQTRLWSMWSILDMSRASPVARTLTGALCRIAARSD